MAGDLVPLLHGAGSGFPWSGSAESPGVHGFDPRVEFPPFVPIDIEWKREGVPLTPGFAIACLSSLPDGLSLKRDNIAAHMSRAETRFSEIFPGGDEQTGETENLGGVEEDLRRLGANDRENSSLLADRPLVWRSETAISRRFAPSPHPSPHKRGEGDRLTPSRRKVGRPWAVHPYHLAPPGRGRPQAG